MRWSCVLSAGRYESFITTKCYTTKWQGIDQMAKDKKYSCRLIQGSDDWTAEITRQVTSKETTVSKSQNGFSTEAELKQFLQKLAENNKRRAAQRK